MRNGVLGAILVLTAGAGLAWGQLPPGGTFSGSAPSVIPPQLPNMGDPGGYGPNPAGMPTSPPQANWDALNPNASNGSDLNYTPHYWVNVEYLMWFPKSANITAPLATSGDPFGMGAGGNAATQLLYGQQQQNYGLDSGVRISGGGSFDSEGRCGFVLSGFQMGTITKGYEAQSNTAGSPLLARPFFDDFLAAPSSLVVASPTLGTGQIMVTDRLNIFGAEANLTSILYRSAPDAGFGYTLGVLGGFRFAAVDETVQVGSNTQLNIGQSASINGQTFAASQTATSAINGTVTSVTSVINNVNVETLDQYKVRNEFYGGNAGLFQQFQFDRFFLTVTGKLALGDMHEVVDVNGATNVPVTTTTTYATANINAAGYVTTSATATGVVNNVASSGLLAQPNSIGHYTQDRFAAVPELNLAFGYQITPVLSVYVGYDVTYFSTVVRPYNMISGEANSAAQPTSANYGSASQLKPFNPFPSSDFWIQGVNFGLTFRY